MIGGLLLAGSGLVVPPAMAEQAYIEVDNLSSFQKSGQRKQMLVRVEYMPLSTYQHHILLYHVFFDILLH